jgi:hypothetical protein
VVLGGGFTGSADELKVWTSALAASDWQGLTLVHYSAQLEPFLPLKLINYSSKSAHIELNSARV